MPATAMTQGLRVLVVDPSPAQRAHLTQLLELDGDIHVVATAACRAHAIDAVLRNQVHLATIALDLPGTLPGDELAGLRAIRTILSVEPLPILVISDLIEGDACPAALDAFAAGAAAVQPPPQDSTDPCGRELRARARALAAPNAAAPSARPTV